MKSDVEESFIFEWIILIGWLTATNFAGCIGRFLISSLSNSIFRSDSFENLSGLLLHKSTNSVNLR